MQRSENTGTGPGRMMLVAMAIGLAIAVIIVTYFALHVGDTHPQGQPALAKRPTQR
jgi:hypothetical protein